MDNGKRYVELAVGSVSNRGIIVPIEEVHSFLKPNEELYVSYFSYDQDIVEHMKTYKTVKSFKGKHYLRNIIFDLDKGALTENALLELVRYFINETLRDEWKLDIDEIQPFFSGRGFHIHTSDFFGFKDEITLPETMATTLSEYFPQADNIYNKNRIIRVNNSFNMKSQLHKIPLSIDEVNSLSVDEIKSLAKTQRHGFEYAPLPQIEKPHTSKILKPYKEDTKERVQVKDDVSGVVTCIQKIFKEGPVKGSRHTKILRMVSSFRRHGIPREGVYAMMERWVPDFEVNEVRRMVDNVFDNGYRYGCNDSIMKEYCSAKCVYHKNKNYTLRFKTIAEIEAEYVNKLRNGESNKIINIKEIFPSAIGANTNERELPKWSISPGQFCIIQGDTGVGKSTFTRFLVHKSGLKTAFCSLEEDEEATSLKFIQMAHSLTQQEMENHYAVHSNYLSNALSAITIDQVPPTIDDIRKYVSEENPDILVIDTTDEIVVPFAKGEIDRQNKVALILKEIAQQQKIIVIGVHHLSKASSKNPTQVGVHDGKGSSSFPQKADKVISINGLPNERRRVVQSVKSRNEPNFIVALDFEYETYQFKEAM